MKKIVIFNDHWCSGGVESLWTNFINEMGNSDELRFTILASQKETDIYDKMLIKNNVKIVTVLDRIYKNPIIRTIKNSFGLKKKLKELNPDILHINSCNASALKYACMAKKLGIKVVIVHSHNTMIENDRFHLKLRAHLFWRKKYIKYPDYRFACSTEAAKFMFGSTDNIYLMKNAVDLSKFDYNEEYRQEIRKKYNLKDEILIGHVGRFSAQKNHMRLLDIFLEINKLNSNTRLMCLGEGELKEEFMLKAKAFGIEKYIIDAGVRPDAYKYYQAFDAFVLPSLHEGLPFVGIEAQAAGLPLVLSNTITKETKILDSTIFMDLNESNVLWAGQVLKLVNETPRQSKRQEIISSGFDLSYEAIRLKNFYLNC